jgi:hypothetical protein
MRVRHSGHYVISSHLNRSAPDRGEAFAFGRRLSMHHYARASLLVFAVLLTASCSDTDARLFATQPSQVASSTIAVSATSATAFAEPVRNPLCPSIAPFNVSFGVIVRATGSSAVVITGIRMLFTDTSERQAAPVTVPMLPVTLAAPGPTMQFGSAQAGSLRTFPLILGIGCGTDRRGTLLVIVDTEDNRGIRTSEQVRIAVL